MKQLLTVWKNECDLLQRILLAALAGMILVFGVLTAAFRLIEGVAFDGKLLKVSQAGGETVYAGGDVTVTVRNAGAAPTVAYTSGAVADTYTVEYPLDPIQTERGVAVDGIRILKNGQPFFTGGYDARQAEFGWYDASGAWDAGIGIYAVASDGTYIGGGPEPFTKNDVMYFLRGPEMVCRGSVGLYLVLAVLSLLVMLNTAAPEALFRLQHMLWVDDPEPTDFYLAMQRVGNCIAAAALLAGYIYAVTLIP